MPDEPTKPTLEQLDVDATDALHTALGVQFVLGNLLLVLQERKCLELRPFIDRLRLLAYTLEPPDRRGALQVLDGLASDVGGKPVQPPPA